MHAPTPTHVAVSRLALSGVAAVIVLNLLLRSLVHLGGVITTLLIASAVGFGMARWFAWRQQRPPSSSERLRLLGVYGGVLALLYLGLLGLLLVMLGNVLVFRRPKPRAGLLRVNEGG